MANRTPKTSRRPLVHKLTAQPLETGRPEIGSPVIGQVHNLQAADVVIGGRTHDVSINGVTTPVAGTAINHATSINAATGVAVGAGQANAEGATVDAEAPEATADGAAGGSGSGGAQFVSSRVPLEVQDAVSSTTMSSPTLTAHDPPRPTPYRARDVMRSSTWTGRRSGDEQVRVIRAFAPEAMAAADQLCAAIRERRRNDPADVQAMEALKELHWAIGDLVRQAERGPISTGAWETYERHREQVTSLALRGTSLTAALPAAVVLAQMFSWITGVPVGETMLTGIYGSIVGSDALRSRRKNS